MSKKGKSRHQCEPKPEAELLKALIKLERACAPVSGGRNPDRGLLVRKEPCFFRLIDERSEATAIVQQFVELGDPQRGERRIRNAFSNLEGKSWVWFEREADGQFRYYLTQPGRDHAARISPPLPGQQSRRTAA